ncbi:hypothetical protein [Paenibacillus sp. FSL K6-2524]
MPVFVVDFFDLMLAVEVEVTAFRTSKAAIQLQQGVRMKQLRESSKS